MTNTPGRVVIKKATFENIEEKVEEIFGEFDISWNGKKVLVKPNVIGPFPKEKHATTHPLMAKAVVDCLESTVENGIFFVGLQGGYTEVDNPKLEDPSFDVPLYFVDGVYVGSPTLVEVESELSDYIETRIVNCVDSLDVEYDEDEINAELSIKDGKVITDLDFPLMVAYEGSSTILDEFYVEVDSDFKKRFEAAKEYVEEQKLSLDDLRTSSLDDITIRNDLEVEVYVYADDNVVFKFVGDEVHPSFSNYTFVFGIKYDW